MENNGWSKETKELTRQILDDVDIVAFGTSMNGKNKGCNMKHVDRKSGYISLNNALDYNWIIQDLETEETLGEYSSIDELLNNGWVVD